MSEVLENRPTKAVISLSNLRHNLSIVKSNLDAKIKILGTVKANAYGHGLLEISQELIKNGVHYLGVAYIEEAIFLRKNGVKIPILVLGAINKKQIPLFLKYDIEITSSSLEKSLEISKIAKKTGKIAKVHLKIDTGMERIGVHWYNAEQFISQSQKMKNMDVVGIFSHLARADDYETSSIQIARFDKIISKLKSEKRCPEIVHLLNSSGIINYKQAQYSMVRAGIILYGYTDEIQEKLRPVMSLKTKISYFKVVPKNTGIGYNHTFVSKQQTRIITMPIGYGDGYFRAFSNKGIIGVRGKIYPVVGNVCMDQIMADIGADGEAYNGDDVLLFGEHENMKIPLEELSKKINTIPYEILCAVSSRVPRRVVVEE